MRLVNYCPNLSMETTFINTKNTQINEPHKFVLNLSQTLDLRSSNKHVALQNLSIICRKIQDNITKIINSE